MLMMLFFPNLKMTKKTPGYATQLRQCAKIAEDRQKKYGPPDENFELISQICDVCFDLKISKEEIIQVMRATKIARDKHMQQEDNLLDEVNYAAMLANFRSQS